MSYRVAAGQSLEPSSGVWYGPEKIDKESNVEDRIVTFGYLGMG
jgi:hypothetical protein